LRYASLVAIGWTSDQRRRVAAILAKHPAESAQCATAARKILPVAREHDPSAVVHQLSPRYGRFVDPRRRWFYHVTVRAADHQVDALTGPDGLPTNEYAALYWPDAEAIRWEVLAEVRLEALG
jgi:hypothetical protein